MHILGLLILITYDINSGKLIVGNNVIWLNYLHFQQFFSDDHDDDIVHPSVINA